MKKDSAGAKPFHVRCLAVLHLKANALMKANIDTLLRARGQSRRDLAQWCRRTDAWIGKIMTVESREFPMKYFDRIADFFGIATYQLLQPGISPLTERRKRTDRRSGQDRRVSRAFPTVNQPTEADLLGRLRLLTVDEREKLDHWIDVLRLGRDGPLDRRDRGGRQPPIEGASAPTRGRKPKDEG